MVMMIKMICNKYPCMVISQAPKLSRKPVLVYLYVFSLCVIVFVLAVAGGPENVWAAAKKYFGPRDLLQTMLTSFFLSKKVGVVLRIHQHCTAAFSLNITNLAVFSTVGALVVVTV